MMTSVGTPTRQRVVTADDRGPVPDVVHPQRSVPVEGDSVDDGYAH